MRPAGDHYEYVYIYIDNLVFIIDNLLKFVNTLQTKHNFKLKNTEQFEYYLGTNFIINPDRILAMFPKKYITERLATLYKTMFGEKPKTKYKSPLERDDHPETDISELLDINGIQQY